MLDFRILGPFEVVDEERPVLLGGPKQRALLAILLLRRGEVVSSDRLIDQLWGEQPPATAGKTLQGYVSRLRKALGNGVLLTRGRGYLLSIAPGQVDADCFTAMITEARRSLADGDLAGARERLESALSLWRGEALSDLAYEPFAASDIARLQEARLCALEDRIDADFALGDHAALVGELEALAREHPLRERLRGQLMLALYRAGRQAEALDVYQHTRVQLTEQLGLEPGPALKKLQMQILDQAPALQANPAIGSDRLPRHDVAAVPQPATVTIGRERETDDVSRLLWSADARLVTLTGPGGVGKTRLAIAVAHATESGFPDGSCWAELAGVIRPEDVGSTLARALGVTPAPGESAEDSLLRYLADKGLLLVIDNFEHVLTAGALISELLESCPRLTVLVTSRERLDLSAEHRVEVKPLAVPAEPETATVDEVQATAATALFLAAAARHDNRFAVTAMSAPAVARICGRLDGLPLALELAAARIEFWSVTELATRLDGALQSLGIGPRDAPARHRTVHATIDWSYRLLDAAQQQAFRHFSVFAGGATIDAARAITGASSETLEALTAKSLLVSGRRSNCPARLVMLETVRHDALQRLAQDPKQGATRRRHFEHYLEFVVHIVERLYTKQQRDALVGLDQEIDNLRSALQWALEAAPVDALRLAIELGDCWISRETYDEVTWLHAALAAAGEDAPTRDRARALLQQSSMFHLDDDGQPFIEAAEEALALYTEVQDHAGMAGALSSLAALVGVLEGDLDAERRYNQEAYEHARISGDERIIGRTLARTAPASGKDRISILEQAAEILTRTGNFQELARSYSYAAWFALGENRSAEAISLLEAAFPAARRVDSPWTMASIWGNLGLARLFSGDTPSAREAFAEQLRVCGDHALHDCTGEGLAGIGAAAALEGRYETAARLRGASRSNRYPAKSDAPIDDRLERDYFAPARAKCGLPVWRRAEFEGEAMSEQQAITYAIAQSDVLRSHTDRPHLAAVRSVR